MEEFKEFKYDEIPNISEGLKIIQQKALQIDKSLDYETKIKDLEAEIGFLKRNNSVNKKDELIKYAQNLISRLQTVYGIIFSIIDDTDNDILPEDKIAKLKNLPKEFQEIKDYRKTLFEYQRGIDTTKKVLDEKAYYDIAASGNSKELLKSFGETSEIGKTNTKTPEDFIR